MSDCYIAVGAWDIQTLAQRVNQYIVDGYIPIGGITTMIALQSGIGESTYYVQPVWRKWSIPSEISLEPKLEASAIDPSIIIDPIGHPWAEGLPTLSSLHDGEAV
jgi:hypothetical protein